MEVGDGQQTDDRPPVAFVGAAWCEEVCAATSKGLVSSPGYGVVDSGCGRTLIGAATLQDLSRMIEQRSFGPVQTYATDNLFRFGNGATERSTTAVRIPVGLAGKYGIIDAAVISWSGSPVVGKTHAGTTERLH